MSYILDVPEYRMLDSSQIKETATLPFLFLEAGIKHIMQGNCTQKRKSKRLPRLHGILRRNTRSYLALASYF